MSLTPDEQEREAYQRGDTERAALLRELIDAGAREDDDYAPWDTPVSDHMAELRPKLLAALDDIEAAKYKKDRVAAIKFARSLI